MFFADRLDAGRRLAARLEHLRGQPVVVLGLPRGGVPVAFEVARSLDAPLDVIVVRKLGVPFQPELGMGAIGEDGIRIINDEIVAMARISESDLAAVEARERAELERRARRFRGDRPRSPLTGRTVVIVDDGIATGSTARAACQVARAQGAESGRARGARRARRLDRLGSVAMPTSASRSTRRSRSGRSASSTPTSPRPPTTRWSSAWRAPPSARQR